MIETKRAIILEEGTFVSVHNHLNPMEDYETTALVGKSTKQFFSEVSLESHRQLQFIPEDIVENGYTVKNLITEDTYIIVAKYPEIIYNQKCATVTRAIVCNSKLHLSRLVETADKYGNIIKKFDYVYSGLDIYAEAIDSKVIAAKPGEFNEVRYTVFAPDIEVEITDRIEIEVRGKKVPFKLTGKDYTTFEGLTLLDLVSETRSGESV